MAITKGSRLQRIEELKKKRDDAIKELDALLLDQAAGGTQSDPQPEPPSGGGPGEEH